MSGAVIAGARELPSHLCLCRGGGPDHPGSPPVLCLPLSTTSAAHRPPPATAAPPPPPPGRRLRPSAPSPPRADQLVTSPGEAPPPDRRTLSVVGRASRSAVWWRSQTASGPAGSRGGHQTGGEDGRACPGRRRNG